VVLHEKGHGHHVAPARGGRASRLDADDVVDPNVGVKDTPCRERQDHARLVDDAANQRRLINSAASLP